MKFLFMFHDSLTWEIWNWWHLSISNSNSNSHNLDSFFHCKIFTFTMWMFWVSFSTLLEFFFLFILWKLGSGNHCLLPVLHCRQNPPLPHLPASITTLLLHLPALQVSSILTRSLPMWISLMSIQKVVSSLCCNHLLWTVWFTALYIKQCDSFTCIILRHGGINDCLEASGWITCSFPFVLLAMSWNEERLWAPLFRVQL